MTAPKKARTGKSTLRSGKSDEGTKRTGRPPGEAVNKKLVKAAMKILRADYSQEIEGKCPPLTLLAQKVYNRPDSTSMSRHFRKGEPLSKGAITATERLSLHAAILLRDWAQVLNHRIDLKALRVPFAEASRRLGVPDEEIAVYAARDTPVCTAGGYALDDPLSLFVAELVNLRRYAASGPVYYQFDQAFKAGIALLRCCASFDSIRRIAKSVWREVLTFAPSEADVVSFGDFGDHLPLPSRTETPSPEERRLRHAGLVALVPCMLANQPVPWVPLFLRPDLDRLRHPRRKPPDEDLPEFLKADLHACELLRMVDQGLIDYDESRLKLGFPEKDADELWDQFQEYCDGNSLTFERVDAFAHEVTPAVSPRGNTYFAGQVAVLLRIRLKAFSD